MVRKQCPIWCCQRGIADHRRAQGNVPWIVGLAVARIEISSMVSMVGGGGG